MHYRVFSNTRAISKFSNVGEECSEPLQQREKMDGLCAHIINLCQKQRDKTQVASEQFLVTMATSESQF